METIGQTSLWTFVDGKSQAVEITRLADIRAGRGHFVRDFFTLAKRVAELQFRNRDYVLLFRGQTHDYINKLGVCTLKPEIFRPTSADPHRLATDTIVRRFDKLRRAEHELLLKYTPDDSGEAKRLSQQHILRWSILQHYKICRTPLLDVTHSLRVAASFASHDPEETSYVYVLGVPNLNGAVTASAEAGLQIIRLASVCPPAAMRPHIQEGYLLGEYPDMSGIEQKSRYRDYEVDFGRRLIAKFRFAPARFWQSGDPFPCVSKAALYPCAESDPFCNLVDKIKAAMKRK